MKLPPKLDNETLDYTFDCAAWLDEGDTITAATIALVSGSVVPGAVTHTDTAVSFWLAGGTRGISRLEVEFETAGGRTFAEAVSIQIL